MQFKMDMEIAVAGGENHSMITMEHVQYATVAGQLNPLDNHDNPK